MAVVRPMQPAPTTRAQGDGLLQRRRARRGRAGGGRTDDCGYRGGHDAWLAVDLEEK